MDTINFVVFVIGPIALFGGGLIWAFGRKRKKRFEDDGRIPFQE
jgi:cbb3-type cytochrome oxidase subunit 3